MQNLLAAHGELYQMSVLLGSFNDIAQAAGVFRSELSPILAPGERACLIEWAEATSANIEAIS
ncbi:MAG: hypothetical protein K5905_14075 [Roseibium sp.]|uniref:hypothetical protein n=1 Tax=Roseibium sp. TaxID=1936156 RepID=UPI002638A07B|nr:hypothetical protein [Roseibium sp.]MCV0426592.1 hypothetical protein [Roseibium sp.]